MSHIVFSAAAICVIFLSLLFFKQALRKERDTRDFNHATRDASLHKIAANRTEKEMVQVPVHVKVNDSQSSDTRTRIHGVCL